jgi:hypothetical protein
MSDASRRQQQEQQQQQELCRCQLNSIVHQLTFSYCVLPCISTSKTSCKSSSSSSSSSNSSTVYQQLLEWATGQPLQQLPVAVQQHPQHGRCLVAVRNIAADEVMLSVGADKAFSSKVSRCFALQCVVSVSTHHSSS